MIIDTLNTFADADSVSGLAAGTHNLADVIDLGLNGRDIGNGTDGMMGLWLVVVVNTTITSAGSATVRFHLASDATSAVATDGTQTIHFASDEFSLSEVNAGSRVVAVRLPLEGNKDYERYLAVQIRVSVAALTGGAVSAFLTEQPNAWKAYAEGQNTPS